MANHGMNRCWVLPPELLNTTYCAFTTITRQVATFAWLALKRAGTLSCLSQNYYLLSIAHEIKSYSRYKAYWFLGKWALNIYYHYYLSKSAIGCTCYCYLFARLHLIFYCSYLLTYLHVHSICTCRCTFDVLKCQLLPSNIVFPAAATAAKDYFLLLGKNCCKL
jgi:hypothetical protein